MDRGPWIQTYTGKKFHPFDPQPEEICIEDIAHALSNICRFTGHCSEFYSVAQHCVYVSARCSDEFKMWGLLHDAAEAYINDLAKPIKDDPNFDVYKTMESVILHAVAKKFGLICIIPAEVIHYDRILLMTEARDLCLLSKDWDNQHIEPLNIKIRPQEPKAAKQSFLDWYDVCCKKHSKPI